MDIYCAIADLPGSRISCCVLCLCNIDTTKQDATTSMQILCLTLECLCPWHTIWVAGGGGGRTDKREWSDGNGSCGISYREQQAGQISCRDAGTYHHTSAKGEGWTGHRWLGQGWAATQNGSLPDGGDQSAWGCAAGWPAAQPSQGKKILARSVCPRNCLPFHCFCAKKLHKKH